MRPPVSPQVRYEDAMYLTRAFAAALAAAARCALPAAANVSAEAYRGAQSPAASKGIASFGAGVDRGGGAGAGALGGGGGGGGGASEDGVSADGASADGGFEQRAMLFNLRQEWRREVPAAHVAAACARLDPALLGLLGYTCDGGIDGAAPSP